MNNLLIGLTTGLVIGLHITCSQIIKEIRTMKEDYSHIHSVLLNEDGSVTLSDGTLCIYNQQSNLWFRASSNLNNQQYTPTNK